MDIVERLREWKNSPLFNWADLDPSDMEEAADEIVRLRDTLENILKIPNSEAAQGIIKVLARAALGFDDRRLDDRGDKLDGN